MPLKLALKKIFSSRSERVKCVEAHPTEPWVITCLYSGTVNIWNYETQQIVKTFEICILPVRVGKFCARKNWIFVGSDDMLIRIFNYNTMEKVCTLEAHNDYIRSISIHPTQSYFLSCSDDMLIKLWDWDKKWTCIQVYEGHTHYVMQVVFNPKDTNQFASASLDKTIKVWQLGSVVCNFTLIGHEKGVNSVDFCYAADKPYLLSGSDDFTAKIWDFQSKSCVHTLNEHEQNVVAVCYFPDLPLIATCSEDHTVKLWHSSTYRLENSLNYGFERSWSVSTKLGRNIVCVGYDQGFCVFKLGQDVPIISMDPTGKLLYAKQNEIIYCNINSVNEGIFFKDNEKIALQPKVLGTCELYPSYLCHSPNGRFVVIVGDGEWIIYTAVSLRSKVFGSGQDFAWAPDSNEYAVRDDSSIKLFRNFKERKSFRTLGETKNIYGGHLLSVVSNCGLFFYDWETCVIIRRIDCQPRSIYWNSSDTLVAIVLENSYFILKYNLNVLEKLSDNSINNFDGFEDAFEVVDEVNESIKTGIWIGDCFIYTNNINHLAYSIGGEKVVVTHLDRPMFILNYRPEDGCIYFSDKELNIIKYGLSQASFDYQTCVMQNDFVAANKIFPSIPLNQRNRIAKFLEQRGFYEHAIAVSNDPEHRLELTLKIGDINAAYDCAQQSDNDQRWKLLANLAINNGDLKIAEQCFFHDNDLSSQLLMAFCSSSIDKIESIAEKAVEVENLNIAFTAYYMLGRQEKCVEILSKSNRHSEAAFMTYVYQPTNCNKYIEKWKKELIKINKKVGESIANPNEYANLFKNFDKSSHIEQFFNEENLYVSYAKDFSKLIPNHQRNSFDEFINDEHSFLENLKKNGYKRADKANTSEILNEADGEQFVSVSNHRS